MLTALWSLRIVRSISPRVLRLFPEHCSDTLFIVTAHLHDQCGQRLPLCQSCFAVVFYERKHLSCFVYLYNHVFVRHLCRPHLMPLYSSKFSFFACGNPIYIFASCWICFFYLVCAHRARCVIKPDLPPPRMPPKGKRPAVNNAYLTRVSKRRRDAAETAENTQNSAMLRQVPANTGQEIASTSSAGGTASQQQASVPEGVLQGITDAIADAVKKSLRDTGLVLPNQ